MSSPVPPVDQEARVPLSAYSDLSQLVRLDLLDPELTDVQVQDSIRWAIDLGLSALCVRPTDVEFAAKQLEGTGVMVASAAGFPHGSSTTAVKLYETRDLLRRGARDIELVINHGKLLGRHFQFLEMEVLQVAQACHESGAKLTLILESGGLADDLKVIACKIAKRAEADFVKNRTGFGAASLSAVDVPFFKRILKDVCGLSIQQPSFDLDQALELYQAGADRLCCTQRPVFLDEWKLRLTQLSQAQTQPEALPGI